MDHGPSDSSGTDDDIPPAHMNREARGGGRVVQNGRASVGTLLYERAEFDMESQIHQLEQEAYSAVLRAFIGQSDTFSWDKEGLISDLRKELRVSDMDHRELLGKVNADEVLRHIREYRKGSFTRHNFTTNAACSFQKRVPTVSATCKRQKNYTCDYLFTSTCSTTHCTYTVGNSRKKSAWWSLGKKIQSDIFRRYSM